MDSSDEIDNIINELKADAIPSTLNVPAVQEPTPAVNDENVNDFVYQKTAEVIQSGLEAMNNLKNTFAMGADPKEIAAMAQLMNAVTKAIDSMNNINLQQKQAKNAVELKKLDIAGKKEIMSKLPPSNNILIATRDEVITKMLDKPKRDRIELLED
jgi:hypothetical protein